MLITGSHPNFLLKSASRSNLPTKNEVRAKSPTSNIEPTDKSDIDFSKTKSSNTENYQSLGARLAAAVAVGATGAILIAGASLIPAAIGLVDPSTLTMVMTGGAAIGAAAGLISPGIFYRNSTSA